VVLVGQSADDLFPADPVLGEVDRLRRRGAGLGRGVLAEGTMRRAGVVVVQVPGQYLAQMVLVDCQQRVEEFSLQGACDSFAYSVRLWGWRES